MKLLYWTIQRRKYFDVKDDCYWYPIETEVRLMTEKQRGIIDCLELCEDKNGLRLIDYKLRPSSFDHLQILLYANLLNNYRLENVDEERFDYEVIEIGCYYYEIGVERTFEISERTLMTLDNILNETRNKIKNIQLNFDNNSYWKCNYKDICSIER